MDESKDESIAIPGGAAKGKNGRRGETVAEAHSDEYGDEVVAPWAEGIGDGEVVEGFYLGYDEQITKYGTKQRHRFRLRSSNEVKTYWGQADLNAKLAEIELGRCVEVSRAGQVKQGSRVRNAYRVRVHPSLIASKGIIGRGRHE